MEHVFPVTGEETCSKCGRAVWVSVSRDENDLNAPYQKSECTDTECPVNASNQPNAIEMIEIGFADSDEET